MSKNIVIVCGAPDPEMTAIERLGSEARCVIVHAHSGGRRVHPSNAYAADAICLPDGTPYSVPVNATVLRVECDGPVFAGIGDVVVCDHHRPGDPGYGRPPEEFLSASSIGQVVAELARLGRLPEDWGVVDADGLSITTPGVVSVYREGWAIADASSPETGCERLIPTDIVLMAAADHCLEAAYRGRCPGVDPDDLMRWRAESRAAFQKRSVEAVLADVEAARKRLREAVAPQGSGEQTADGVVYYDPPEYADLRGRSIPELPEAAARDGIPFIADQTDRDGRRKVVLMAAPPELIQRFLAGEIVPGLVDTYGDPMRGFAGGHLPS